MSTKRSRVVPVDEQVRQLGQRADDLESMLRFTMMVQLEQLQRAEKLRKLARAVFSANSTRAVEATTRRLILYAATLPERFTVPVPRLKAGLKKLDRMKGSR